MLNRRQFGARCAAFGWALPTLGTMSALQQTQVLAAANASPTTAHTVRLPDGTVVPALGQGTWHLGQGRHPLAEEEEALHAGIAEGMSLIDTSGNYGDGQSERFLSGVIAGQRDRIFLVSKVEPADVAGDGIARACEASLGRLGTDYLNLYLMHQPVPSSQLAAVVAAFEQLRKVGKIRAWGISNFSRSLMEDLYRVPDGRRCATNQVPYSLNRRDIESEVLPWCIKHNMPLMAWSPLGGDIALVIGNPTLAKIAATHGCSAAAVALAWVIRSGKVIAIPESGSPEHVRQNAVALSLKLTPQDLQILDAAAFPGT